MLGNAIGRLRVIALLEGSSFLVLLGIAMPLKYLAGMPTAVKAVGMLHGVLFVLYVMALAVVNAQVRWPMTRLLLLFVAAVVPFGTFVADASLKREQYARA